RRTFGNTRCAITPPGFAHNLEIPGIQTPALSPIMNRCSADCIHHRMDCGSRSVWGRGIGAMRRNLAIDLLRLWRPSAAVSKLVGRHFARADPWAGLDRNNLDTGSRN